MKKTAIIFIGIQASGKTSFYQKYLASNYQHVNLDTLHTRNKEWLAIEECVERGQNLVIDNTNPTKTDRARYIPYLRDNGYRIIGYFFESKVQDCVRRNDQRTGKAKIPSAAIAATSNKLEMPSLKEGFDELYFNAWIGDDTIHSEEWRD